MNTKQAYIGILLFSLLLSSLFVPLALSQSEEETVEDIQVILKSPEHDSTVTSSFNISFIFLPKITSNDKYQDAALVVNGTTVAYNQTKIADNAENKIYYQVPSNGTYEWNVIVRNSTHHSVQATNFFNLTVAVYVADPTPTPAPTATPTPTHAPTPTATPTVHPTVRPSPTPIPTEISLDTWTIIIIAIFVVVIVGALVLVLLRRKH